MFNAIKKCQNELRNSLTELGFEFMPTMNELYALDLQHMKLMEEKN